MSDALDRLAEAHGIALSYRNEAGEDRIPSAEAKRRLLAVLGVASGTDEDIRSSLASAAAVEAPATADAAPSRCFVPHWLEHGRAWGITCQLYGLRTDRNWGIGDFEDLADFAEMAATAGADFVGVNPLHALHLCDPTRFSPYSPSSRRFLNPLYIAVDRLGKLPADQAPIEEARSSDLVDYQSVTRLKRAALEHHFIRFQDGRRSGAPGVDSEFDGFCRERGEALAGFALHEALCEALVGRGLPSGWLGWPEEFRNRDSEAVSAFRDANANRILFHTWLQWIAFRQLAEAQKRAVGAGMRIGLYLDVAVGAAPDGADTWCEPDTVLAGARIGSPPDYFNDLGQDWGLAPLSPEVLRTNEAQAFYAFIFDIMRSAGAIRIDHAMGIVRLYLIADGLDGADGAYVHYPLAQMLRALAAASNDARAVVIGEDLGTVPSNFRETMREAEIQGYRVLLFERDSNQRFLPPDRYTREALACVATHDLPTLRGWWCGTDLDDLEDLGIDDQAGVTRRRSERAADRDRLLQAIAEAGLLPDFLAQAVAGTAPLPADLPLALAAAVHRFLASAPCRLLGVQIEDLAGARDRANLPGTTDEHPNWRRKLPLTLNEIVRSPTFAAIVEAVAQQRPRSS